MNLFYLRNTLIKIVLLFLFFSVNEQIQAAIPNSLFSNHMVLQQRIRIPVWGHGRNGEAVKIELNGQIANTIVRDNCWEASFKPMKAGGPFTMTITGDSIVTIQDIYIGEVWVCSGQSNMGRKMSPHWKYKTITNYEKEKIEANYPLIRQYEVPEIKSDTMNNDARGKWTVCSPSTVESFSAVAYFFARDLHTALKVPVGLLLSSVGGTQASFWTSRSGLKNNSKLLPLVQAYDSALIKYQRAISTKLEAPQNPQNRRRISCYFNGMIAPLTKYPMKGVIWYQGESDVDFAAQYQSLFPTLISDWRNAWKLGNFPFLYVQIAPFKKNIPELREAQLQALNVPNTAMVVTTDCGDENDIHPPYKQPVGYRLSLAARALAYHEKITYSGPIYKSYKVKRNTIEISFSHVGKGLKCHVENLTGFSISGSDKNFLQAKAVIKANKVIVYNDSIKTPLAVRYGWATVPNVNLYNSDNLPASPFRTDVP